MASHEDFLSKELREKEEDQLLYEQTLHALRTEERFVNYLKQYNSASVENFIKYYAGRKVYWHRHGGNFEHYADIKLKQERHEVVNLLKNLMYKKVFDLKCRWVGGEMDLDCIERSEQFSDWETNIELIKAVGPIRADEFYCYLHWFEIGSPERLDEDGHPEASPYIALDHFHRMRSCYHSDPLEDIPDWFHEYDRCFGTAPLLSLPTTRRDMEEDLLDAWVKEVFYDTLTPEQQKYHRPLDRATRKRLKEDPEFDKQWHDEGSRLYYEQQAGQPQYESFSTYNRKIMDEVVAAIEPRDSQKCYRDSRIYRDMSEGDDRLFTPLQYLKSVEEHVAVEANDDFEDSIRQAFEQHNHQTNYQALRILFAEYEKAQRSNSPFDWKTHDFGHAHVEERRRIVEVLKKRGLPENFDFLKKDQLS